VTAHLPVLIVLLPLAAAVVVPLVGLASARAARAVSLLALLLASLCSVGALRVALVSGTWRYELGGWAPPWGIEYVVDPLAGGMAALVSFMALLTAFHSDHAAGGRSGLGSATAHALHLLLAAGLLGIVVTGDAFNLYVFLEISAIAAYALIAGGGARAEVAAFRYLLVGTVAASFYLLGIGYLYAATGTLNLADLAARLPLADRPEVVGTGLALIVIGLLVKIALFPLHGWLPDAYAYAPVPIAAFVSSVMGKVGAYVALRFLFFVFPGEGLAQKALDLLAPVAAAAVIAGSVMALAQRDLRRMLAYSSVGQTGYIVLGFGLGNAAGLTGALLHAVNHAVMKACLFLSAGNMRAGAGAALVDECRGIAARVPVTMAVFVVAAASMIGLPPLGGFFSKWYLVQGALERGAWVYVAAIVAGSALTAVYMLRVVEAAYFRPAAATAAGVEVANGPLPASAEAPSGVLVPMIVLAMAALGLGLFNQALVDVVLSPALSGVRS
jgi:multicomponent Na+:H+ antiporter subunit D